MILAAPGEGWVPWTHITAAALYTKLYTIRRVRDVRLALKTCGKTPLVISPWGRHPIGITFGVVVAERIVLKSGK
jgi:hypothetical protein